MPGKGFIKVTSVLFIIGAIISVIVYTIAGLFLGYATVKTGEGMGWIFVVVCLFYTLLAVLQLIASAKGIKGCNDKNAAPDLKRWGYILIVVALISGIVNLVQTTLSGKSIAIGALSVLIGLLLPILYVYGATLNEKA